MSNVKCQMLDIIMPVSLLIFLFLPFIVFGGLVPCGGTGQPDCTLCHFLVLAQNIIEFLRNAGLALGALFIAWGGFLLLTSGESEERRAKGKETLRAAIIGIIIILASWIIINTILTFAASGGKLKGILENWSVIECK